MFYYISIAKIIERSICIHSVTIVTKTQKYDTPK